MKNIISDIKNNCLKKYVGIILIISTYIIKGRDAKVVDPVQEYKQKKYDASKQQTLSFIIFQIIFHSCNNK